MIDDLGTVSFSFLILAAICFFVAGCLFMILVYMRREESWQILRGHLEAENELCRQRAIERAPPQPLVLEFPSVERAANDG
jgi:hypothetical protein